MGCEDALSDGGVFRMNPLNVDLDIACHSEKVLVHCVLLIAKKKKRGKKV